MMVALNARQSFGTYRNPSYPFLQCSAISVQAPWVVATRYVGSTRSSTQFEINSGATRLTLGKLTVLAYVVSSSGYNDNSLGHLLLLSHRKSP